MKCFLIVLTCSLLLAAVGCSVINQKDAADQPRLAKCLALTSSTDRDLVATVLYADFEKSFLVGCYVGTNASEIARLLVKAEIREVMIETRQLIEGKSAAYLQTELMNAGIKVVPGNSLSSDGYKQENARILLGTFLKPDAFFLAVDEERSMKPVVRSLSSAGVNAIIFQSEVKYPPEAVKNVCAVIASAGLTLDQFWVPSGSVHPGIIDLMSRH